MNSLNNINEKKRMYFLVSYLLGYLVCLMQEGIPNLLYLMPIKVIPLVIGYFMGDFLYLSVHEELSISEVRIKSLNSLVPAFSFLIVSLLLQKHIYLKYGIDIGFLIGVEAK